MPGRILAATDFSAAGTRALRAAALWSTRSGAALRIVHAVPPRRWLGGPYAGTQLRGRIAGSVAAALRREAAALGLPAELEVSTGIVEGAASAAIRREALAFGADLVVVGARGEREVEGLPAGLGGTAAKLVSVTSAPLLLVRREPDSSPPVVIACVDLGPESAVIVQWAALAARGAQLRLLHAYDVGFSERLAAYGLAERALDVYTSDVHAARERALAGLLPESLAASRIVVTRGDATRALHALSRDEHATCVVVGKHVRRPRRRPATGYGSVCRYAAEHLACDVLVVPPAAHAPSFAA